MVWVMRRKKWFSWTLWAVTIAVVGLMDHFAWYYSYGYFLVGACAFLGYQNTNRGWVLAGLLSLAAPMAHLWMRLLTGYHAGYPWYYDAGVRLAGGILLSAVGLGAGFLARLCWVAARRVRQRAA
jgi:hypothetical protein